jgi:hypothetical protein
LFPPWHGLRQGFAYSILYGSKNAAADQTSPRQASAKVSVLPDIQLLAALGNPFAKLSAVQLQAPLPKDAYIPTPADIAALDIQDVIQAFHDAGNPADLAPRVTGFVQKQYESLASSGYWLSTYGQPLGHELRAQGYVVDPTQGGMFPTVETEHFPDYIDYGRLWFELFTIGALTIAGIAVCRPLKARLAGRSGIRRQSIALWVGVAVAVLPILFPPWRYYGQSQSFAYTIFHEGTIDLYKLAVEMFAVLLVTGVATVTLRDR